jgi:hypothetical protein
MRRAVALAPLLALVVAAGCASVKDLEPGGGASETFTGRSYDDVWAAAVRVASDHFALQESDKARGIIRAERTVRFTPLGEYLGIFVTPPESGAASYRVEVVTRKKVATQGSGQEWETKVLRGMRDLLTGRPLR